MRVIQTISFLGMILGAGGIENQNKEFQPVAIGILFVSVIVALITSRKEKAWTKHYQN